MNDWTVVIPTSPVPVHPSTDMIERCLSSVREQLPDARILVMADGVRDEQIHTRGLSYAVYLERLSKLVTRYGDTWLHESKDHQHQANLMRFGLDMADTPCVLYVEHDFTLHGEVPWDDIAAVLKDDVARFVRLSMSEIVSPYYEHLFDPEPKLVTSRDALHGVRLIRTRQFSTWPHAARTDVYKRVLRAYFDHTCRTMIEPVLWPVVHNNDWDDWRVWMYAPDGDMSRCTHHYTVRGDDPVYPFHIVYPSGITPKGAPAP